MNKEMGKIERDKCRTPNEQFGKMAALSRLKGSANLQVHRPPEHL